MPWRKISGRIVFDNPWIRVHEDRVENPRGGINDYGWVHMKGLAIAVLPVDEEGFTFLVGQDRYTLGKYSWELPMGGGDLDTPPIDSAKRELSEETGYSAQRWTELMQLDISNSVTDERAIIFLAEGLVQGNPDPDDTELLTVRRLPLAQAIDMAMNGDITDAISVAALLRMATR